MATKSVKKRRKGMDPARVESILAMLPREVLLEIKNAPPPKKKKPRGRPPVLLTGKRIGKWHVGPRADKKGRVYYLCMCDCSVVAIVDASNLVRGQSRQCRDCAGKAAVKHLKYARK